MTNAVVAMCDIMIYILLYIYGEEERETVTLDNLQKHSNIHQSEIYITSELYQSPSCTSSSSSSFHHPTLSIRNV